MTSFNAFCRLLGPCVVGCLGLLVMGGHGETQLIGVAMLSVGLAWLLTAFVVVAKSLPPVAVASGRRGFPVMMHSEAKVDASTTK